MFSYKFSRCTDVRQVIIIHDQETGQTTGVSVSLDGTLGGGAVPCISADGNQIAFHSDDASNLVIDDTNGVYDVFVHDRSVASLDIPLFLQIASPWHTDLYGSYQTQPNNIGKWGCYMTSAAMIINYYAEQSQSAFRTDPREFNSWLRDNSLYAVNNFVQVTTSKHARQNGVDLFIPSPGRIDGPRNTASDEILNNSLAAGNPAILRVDAASASGHHFVVATGVTTVNNTPTYAINDPIHGQTTLYEQYNNQYTSIRLFSNQETELRTLSISAHSPVELLVTDPQGRKSGYDPSTGTHWNEIPDTSYTIDAIAPDGGLGTETPLDVKILYVYAPIDGTYTVEVFGTGEGPYQINAFASDLQEQITRMAFDGAAQVDSVDSINLVYDSNSGLQNSMVFLPLIINN